MARGKKETYVNCEITIREQITDRKERSRKSSDREEDGREEGAWRGRVGSR